jgi:hypothetical protein
MNAIFYVKDLDKNGKVDLRTTSLAIYDFEAKQIVEQKPLNHLTDKGYYSKKPLYVEFATPDRIKTAPTSMRYIELTDEEYHYLDSNFTKQGKIFQTEWQRHSTDKAVGLKAWCSVMKDPYDRG